MVSSSNNIGLTRAETERRIERPPGWVSHLLESKGWGTEDRFRFKTARESISVMLYFANSRFICNMCSEDGLMRVLRATRPVLAPWVVIVVIWMSDGEVRMEESS